MDITASLDSVPQKIYVRDLYSMNRRVREIIVPQTDASAIVDSNLKNVLSTFPSTTQQTLIQRQIRMNGILICPSIIDQV